MEGTGRPGRVMARALALIAIAKAYLSAVEAALIPLPTPHRASLRDVLRKALLLIFLISATLWLPLIGSVAAEPADKALPSLRLLQVIRPPAAVSALAWNSDGSKLAGVVLLGSSVIPTLPPVSLASPFGRRITIWNADGSVFRELDRPDTAYTLGDRIAFVAGDTQIAAPPLMTSQSLAFSVFDVASGAVVREVRGPLPDTPRLNRGQLITASPDQSILALSYNAELPVELYSTKDWSKVADLSEDPTKPRGSVKHLVPFYVKDLSFSRDGRLLAVLIGKVVRIYDVRSAQITQRIEISHFMTKVALSPDGSKLAVAFNKVLIDGPDASVEIFDVRDASRIATYPAGRHTFSGLEWSPDGRLVAFITGYRTLHIWDPMGSEKRERTVDLGAFTAGWIVTLLKAHELGLDAQPASEDFRAGNDNLSGTSAPDFLVGGAGGDTLHGGDGDDRLRGGADHDVLQGGNGNDILLGEAGDDLLNGGPGNDTIDGGTGSDRAVFAGVRAASAVFRIGDRIQVTGPDGTDTLTNVEFAQFNDGTVLDLATVGPNQAPVIASNGGGPTATIGQPENTGFVTTVIATDPNGGAITYSIVGGDDAARFLINSATGALFFIAAPDFENPADADHNNSYVVQVRVSDGILSADQLITVGISNVPEVRWTATVDTGVHPAGWLPVATRDFNHDGTSDVLWFNAANNDVDLWTIAGGHFSGGQDIGAHPAGWQLAPSGDYNHDGTSDVLWFNPGSGDTEVWKIQNGQWAGSFDIGLHPLGGWQPAAAGDFNADGTSDVLWFNAANGGDIDVWMILNAQFASGVHTGPHPAGWQPVGTGDFDHDGTSDVLWYNPTTGGVDLWKIQNGHWAASVDLGTHPAGWAPAGIGDFNADGTSDIAWFNAATGGLEVWLMANGHWAGSVNIGAHPLGSSPAGIGDFDHNGVSDILWREASTNRIETWLLAAETLPVRGPPGDFSGDLRSDILLQNSDGRVAIWAMNGPAITGGTVLADNPGPAWHVVDAADFSGDGKPDILWQADDGWIMMWTMDGVTRTGAAMVGGDSAGAGGWHVKNAADFSGDGKADILLQNSDGRVAIWTMNGPAISGGTVLPDNPGPAWHVVDAADFTGDGKPDILWQADDGWIMMSTMDGVTRTGAAMVGSDSAGAWHAMI